MVRYTDDGLLRALKVNLSDKASKFEPNFVSVDVANHLFITLYVVRLMENDGFYTRKNNEKIRAN